MAEPPRLESSRDTLTKLLANPTAANEETYHHKVYYQALEDLRTLYTHPNTQVTLASFTDGTKPGADGGFGLHETRLLEIEGRTLTANIQWPFLPKQCGFTFPDEIRIRSQAFLPEGKKAPDPAQDYIVARFRVSWNDQNEPQVHLEPQFDAKAANGRYHRRVPISVFSCITCHDTGNGHAPKFLAPDEQLDPRFIVQKSQYGLPLEKTEGYLALEAYLREHIPDPKDPEKTVPRYTDPQIDTLLTALKDRTLLDLPSLPGYLRKTIDSHSISTLGDDLASEANNAATLPMLIETGTYRRGDQYYLEPTEAVMRADGKGLWWSERVAIPKRF